MVIGHRAMHNPRRLGTTKAVVKSESFDNHAQYSKAVDTLLKKVVSKL